MVAEEAIKGAREKMARGTLYAGGVQIKEIGLWNVDKLFVPGVRELVKRYLKGC
jgi:hypothetical protein